MPLTPQTIWHTKTASEVLAALGSHERGLAIEEAKTRLDTYGANKLSEGKPDGLLLIFARQFQSPLIYLLCAAGAVIAITGQITDAYVVFGVLLFNAVVGTLQEGRAQNTLRALKKFAATSATVVRDGKELIIPDTDVVPGDVIILQEGEKIPADARIIFAHGLTVNEAGLTGESEPAAKIEAPLKDSSLTPADRKNMIFKGTHVAGGNARAIVIATGSATEIGRIAEEIALIDTDIPLKKDIRYLSRLIIIAVGIISVLLFIPGVLMGRSAQEMFATAVALAVSVIPEGLPIVITLVLATGVWRMSKRNALVKRLQAVEALGQTKIIAVDKTGTLTRNEMTIERVYTNWRMYMITGNGYEPKGDVLLDSTLIDPLEHEDVLFSAKIAAFCARARLSFSEATHEWKVAGDPTEAALLVFSEKIGLRHEILTEESPEIFELPFDYRRKYHAVARAVDGTHFLTVVGAPESVLALCKNIRQHGRTDMLTDDEHKRLQTAFSNMAAEGFRVVAYAIHTDAGTVLNPDAMPPLTFVGFFGMRDPLRPEVQETVRRIKAADMRIVMITGDHRLTAQAIAKSAGIWQEGDHVLTGDDIGRLSDAELARELARTSVFARVTPEHKLRIIQAYRARGEVVAMTGDGVNDAPSLVAADLGVAMGKVGTEVAKEAADIVLLNDDFSSILSAVEEGRNIFRTIQKVVLYLFSTSAGEVLTIAGAIALGFTLPLLPSQIIWLNFVTDGFLDVALAMEPKEKSLLNGAFKRPKKWFVDGLMARRIIFMALPMAAVTLYIFSGYISADMTKAWTISLTLLAVFQWFNAWNCRSEDRSVFSMNPFANKFLIAATATVIVLQIFAVYHPIMNRLLHTTPLGLAEWLLIVPLAASVVAVEEVRKFFHRRSLAVQAIL
ncbi:MAG: hypothetical protein A3J58_02160 [Candidatus Sungbacteria bacterium RIFCSPHIGHO2_02_FULL_52_23]|uniref:Cation-transporting P-type ATPase N-terminal domain-containing protein n=1 Tax=Candidatus Sungbacteria bacterium RIFCSPHIGHO2_02_FULL_52_23 TaxID=1802274 RepID=A0A1G2KU79_9BACT|nr:MAG: hypothetical protein A3J58_02160 [Candidatus Sungbacteria bacterium RIFCSPHIGHO2_02_FULL_52_23]